MTERPTPSVDAITRLQLLRDELDKIDEQFLDALRRRIECCVRIGEYKAESGVPVMQPKRITFVKERAARYGEQHGIDQGFLERLYDLIIGETCRVESVVTGLPVD
ncbi:chorismate mutase family protein [Mycobacteroides abscessus]|uniref:chorismate mutase family protein n=1 Tax=Mycobacteroides abscessus TaxID=36809 RepID=UPI0009A5EDA7|nr:chorismate mutase family protein [Mycobacteroides abscessus]SKT93824.1 Salicylate biosynthesis protein pchB [Mycobacteroides abscessus subsp. massiliense]SKU18892.1 Salicylate biosynthesis protein pchB [Mycobacteroides abscessus subsp. massiliense]